MVTAAGCNIHPNVVYVPYILEPQIIQYFLVLQSGKLPKTASFPEPWVRIRLETSFLPFFGLFFGVRSPMVTAAGSNIHFVHVV